mmetsp:Transcript_12920/g.47251  ORF Transcript_12920/g.47251 Transcript_12920/m.47251 type:complete len:884 (-) Transcript_12920:46-2697(-)
MPKLKLKASRPPPVTSEKDFIVDDGEGGAEDEYDEDAETEEEAISEDSQGTSEEGNDADSGKRRKRKGTGKLLGGGFDLLDEIDQDLIIQEEADAAKFDVTKPLAQQRSKRRRRQVNYLSLQEGDEQDNELGIDLNAKPPKKPKPAPLEKLIEALSTTKCRTIAKSSASNVARLNLRHDGLKEPLIVEASDDTRHLLGFEVPTDLSVEKLLEVLGEEHVINTMKVSTQSEGPRMTMQQFHEYWHNEEERERNLLNVVSLPLHDTKLKDKVWPPKNVRQLDLVSLVWPKGQDITHEQPNTLLYALMSPRGAYTDFHLDFGGSAVWYHMVSGRKTFVLAPPTKANLEAFEEWAGSEKQASTLYVQMATDPIRVEIGAGETMLLPGGWPHAVSTAEDSIVVGGNFLSSLQLDEQIEVWNMEERLEVQPKFRFPRYQQVCWYTAKYFTARLEQILRRKQLRKRKHTQPSEPQPQNLETPHQAQNFGSQTKQDSIVPSKVPACSSKDEEYIGNDNGNAALPAELQTPQYIMKTDQEPKIEPQAKLDPDVTAEAPAIGDKHDHVLSTGEGRATLLSADVPSPQGRPTLGPQAQLGPNVTGSDSVVKVEDATRDKVAGDGAAPTSMPTLPKMDEQVAILPPTVITAKDLEEDETNFVSALELQGLPYLLLALRRWDALSNRNLSISREEVKEVLDRLAALLGDGRMERAREEVLERHGKHRQKETERMKEKKQLRDKEQQALERRTKSKNKLKLILSAKKGARYHGGEDEDDDEDYDNEKELREVDYGNDNEIDRDLGSNHSPNMKTSRGRKMQPMSISDTASPDMPNRKRGLHRVRSVADNNDGKLLGKGGGAHTSAQNADARKMASNLGKPRKKESARDRLKRKLGLR